MMTRQRWREVAPMSTKDRISMNKMNPECFLDHSDPTRPKYPVCPNGSNIPTCQGIDAALRRARMQRNQNVIKKAETLKESMSCGKSKNKIKKESLTKLKKESIAKVKKEPIAKVKKEPIRKVKKEPIAKVKKETIGKIKKETIRKIKKEPSGNFIHRESTDSPPPLESSW
jgi:hypothetical protein